MDTAIIGTFGHCPVAPDALQGIKRQQTNPSRWDGSGWPAFAAALLARDVELLDSIAARGAFATDAGGTAYGLPHGVVIARNTQQIATLLQTAQQFRVPVTVRGGGLTTEGESVAFGGVLLDMTGMSRVLHVDAGALTVRTEAGIFWHSLAEELRRHDLDYLSAPLNLTSSVGGTLGVGGIDVNSPRLGCSADQALALQVVTPVGEVVECSDTHNAELFQRVILGYGQFGVITEATLKVRRYTPLRMHYFYYASLRTAIEDLQLLDRNDASDYSGILTIMDCAVNLLVAFDTPEREAAFHANWRGRLRGRGEIGFALYMLGRYALRPWRLAEAWYLYQRKRDVFPEFRRPEHMRDGFMHDRTVVFSRAVWNHWGSRQMVIPDLATSPQKFVEAVERGNGVCRKYFPHYTLYCVGIRLRPDHRPHYEMSCIPPDAEGWAYGCEFEPVMSKTGNIYSRDHLQSFKNEIYDIGVDIGASYYRFGGMMKGYIRRVFGDALVDRHLAMKRAADRNDFEPQRHLLMFGRSDIATKADFAACSGCSLCLLVCPVWRKTRDLRYTPHGRAKALQHGAGIADITASIESCTLCGACEPVCPEEINLVGMIVDLRLQLPRSAALQALQSGMDEAQVRPPTHAMTRAVLHSVLLPGAALRSHAKELTRVTALLKIALSEDDGTDIALALEAGALVPTPRLEQFLEPLRRLKSVVVADGLLLHHLRDWLPRVKIVSLGATLSRLAAVRQGLRKTDLYVIEPRAYHADHRRLVGYYDRLRADTGCTMNLDLQRIAIPATARNRRHRLGLQAPDDTEQVRWILHERKIQRIVVESVEDIAAFEQVCDLPVVPLVHLADLADDEKMKTGTCL